MINRQTDKRKCGERKSEGNRKIKGSLSDNETGKMEGKKEERKDRRKERKGREKEGKEGSKKGWQNNITLNQTDPKDENSKIIYLRLTFFQTYL